MATHNNCVALHGHRRRIRTRECFRCERANFRASFHGDIQGADRRIATLLAQKGLSAGVVNLFLLDRAKVREAQDRLQDALADFSTAIQSGSLAKTDIVNAFLERGLLLDALNRPDEAIGDFDAALQVDPQSAKGLQYRASVYRRQDRIPEAQQDYRSALDADKAGAEYSYFGLGQIAETQGDIIAARVFYSKALAINPEYGLALERLKTLSEGLKPRATSSAPTNASISENFAEVDLHIQPAPAKQASGAPPSALDQEALPKAPFEILMPEAKLRKFSWVSGAVRKRLPLHGREKCVRWEKRSRCCRRQSYRLNCPAGGDFSDYAFRLSQTRSASARH